MGAQRVRGDLSCIPDPSCPLPRPNCHPSPTPSLSPGPRDEGEGEDKANTPPEWEKPTCQLKVGRYLMYLPRRTHPLTHARARARGKEQGQGQDPTVWSVGKPKRLVSGLW